LHSVQNLEKFQVLPDGTLETDAIQQLRTKNMWGAGCKSVFSLAEYVRSEAQVHKDNYKGY
jgi:hypothetical protein